MRGKYEGGSLLYSYYANAQNGNEWNLESFIALLRAAKERFPLRLAKLHLHLIHRTETNNFSFT